MMSMVMVIIIVVADHMIITLSILLLGVLITISNYAAPHPKIRMVDIEVVG